MMRSWSTLPGMNTRDLWNSEGKRTGHQKPGPAYRTATQIRRPRSHNKKLNQAFPTSPVLSNNLARIVTQFPAKELIV